MGKCARELCPALFVINAGCASENTNFLALEVATFGVLNKIVGVLKIL